MELTSQFVKTATELANKSSFESFNREPVVYPRVLEVVDADSMADGLDYWQKTEIINHGRPREILPGQDHKFDKVSEGWTAYGVIRMWQKGFEIDKSMLRNLDRNPHLVEDFIKSQSAAIGAEYAQGRDQLAADVFNRGAITAGDRSVFTGQRAGLPQKDPYPGLIYDGNPLFDSAHPLYRDAATTYANLATSAFSSANLQTALTAMRVTNAKDEHQQPIVINPDVIIYNPTLDFAVRAVLNSVLVPGSTNNDANVLQGILTPVPWHKITGTDDWILGQARKGIKFVRRGTGPVPIMDEDKLRGAGVLQFSFLDEYAIFVDQWRYWYACNLPTS